MAKKLSTSPKGTLVYPHLNTADTKFDSEGVYHTGLRLPVDDPKAIALMETIDQAAAQAVATAREEADTSKAKKAVKQCEDLPYKIETDDDDNETGFVKFTFKMKASGTVKKTGEAFTQQPALFDAAGTPLAVGTKIGGGSIARISYEIVEFFTPKIGAGVSLRMKGVQIVKLGAWSGGDASAHGFGDESEDNIPEDDGEDEEETQPVKKTAKKVAPKKKAPVVDEAEEEEVEDDDF